MSPNLSPADLPRMYTTLARWWPLLSPTEEYEDEAAMIAGLLRSALGMPDGARPSVLELGSGGGHNAVHLAPYFDLTLSDLSPDMLAVSKALLPEVEHVQGDMRTVQIGRTFDAVLVHDAIDYMLTLDDLAAVFATAAAHLREGGVALFMPDHVREVFGETTQHGGSDGDDGSGIRYLEWTWDADPSDTVAQTQYTLVMREPDGTVSIDTQAHTFGVFGVQDWVDLLHENGFDVTTVDEQVEEDEVSRTLFVATLIGPS